MAWCLDTVVTLPLPFVDIVAIFIWSVDGWMYIYIYKSNPTTGLVAFGVSGRLRLQNF